MFLLNSRLGLFSAPPSRLGGLPLHGSEYPFSRSYGVNLPSSLTRVLPRTLGFSPRLPVSVCGTGTQYLARGFSWQCGVGHFGTYFPSPSRLRSPRRISLPGHPTRLDRHDQRPAALTLLRYPFAQSILRRYRNFNRLSIGYAIRPRLRPRLTLSGRALLRKP